MAAGAAATVAAGLGMPLDAATPTNNVLLRVPTTSIFPAPPPPPASHLHAAGPDSVLAAALVAVRATAAEGLARVREATLAWERKRDAVDALACQIAEAEQILSLPASPDVGATSSGSTGHRVAHTAVLWHDPANPLVAQLHYEARVSRTSGSCFRSSSSLSRLPTPAGGTWSFSLYVVTPSTTTSSSTSQALSRPPRGCASTASSCPGLWGRSPSTSTTSSATLRMLPGLCWRLRGSF